MTTSTESLDLAQIIIYAIMTPPAFHCLFTHGKHGILGWLYTIVMCGLRLVGNGISYNALTTTGQPNKAALIISGVGLSPLLLAGLCILHEANVSIQVFLPKTLNRVAFLIPHLVVAGGVALAAASSKGYQLMEAGMVIFGIGWVIVLGLTLQSWIVGPNHRRMNGERKLLCSVLFAMPLIGVRILYTLVSVFKDHKAESGGLAIQVVFGTLPEFLVMINYLTIGIITRNVARDRVQTNSEPSETLENMLFD